MTREMVSQKHRWLFPSPQNLRLNNLHDSKVSGGKIKDEQ